MSKPIYHITPFTLLDYPDKTACIIWFAGCNMRCKYCYNIDIVKGKGHFRYEDVLPFIESRKNLLDGVVLSGGECTMHADVIPFVEDIKKRNMLVKVDTNGSNPKVLEKLLSANLVDYVALDFKALAKNFYHVTQSDLFTKFEKSLNILLSASIPFEVRTTFHSTLLELDELISMVHYLGNKKYKGIYYIQHFLNHCETLGDVGNDYRRVRVEDLKSDLVHVVVRN
ncbi:MAG: anaerobic ribonucleoside-triphosphate reductase activating protein [Saprospiraceae bacterium]|nr:anaerobic ribonucleoside-triphosphate reductase activating protein [Candidatus Defluviibacterium haderslevense]